MQSIYVKACTTHNGKQTDRRQEILSKRQMLRLTECLSLTSVYLQRVVSPLALAKADAPELPVGAKGRNHTLRAERRY